MDSRKLADLLRTGMLRPVYHGENGLRTLRELGRSFAQRLIRETGSAEAVILFWFVATSLHFNPVRGA